MKHTTKGKGLLALATLTVTWAIWAHSGRVGDAPRMTDVRPIAYNEIGARGDKGNLLGIQPWLRPTDYANAATLTARLDTYLDEAARRGLLTPKTIAIFPEYTGTWLVAANEKRSVYSEATLGAAMQTVALTHLPRFLTLLASAPGVVEKSQWALLNLKSEGAARDYQTVFGELARRHKLHLVAGSLLLPEPHLLDGQIRVRVGGTLYNVSAVFGPDGQIVPPLVVKVFPIADELTFLAGGKTADLPVFPTPAGRLAVLICADAWYPTIYARLHELGAELLAVPSYSAGEGLWSMKWRGYSGAAMPADVDPSDADKITVGEAWLKYPMPMRALRAGIHHGLNVFLRGDLWDLGSDGATIHVSATGSGHAELVRQAVLTSLWLG